MALGLAAIHTHVTTKGQIRVTPSTGPQVLQGHRENMQTLTEGAPGPPEGDPGPPKSRLTSEALGWAPCVRPLARALLSRSIFFQKEPMCSPPSWVLVRQ